MDAYKDLQAKIAGGKMDSAFERLYKTGIASQKLRYLEAIGQFARLFGSDRQPDLFSAPGRTELSGNHTDHQHGRVLAAAVTLDTIAVAAPRSDNIVNIQSEGFELSTADLVSLDKIEDEIGSSSSLIRGVAADLAANGFAIGGFDAYTTSTVPAGSGLSSSAAFEVLIGTIFSHFYNSDSISAIQLAKTGQFAENSYFGKPCGLMDQTAVASGNVVAIDFQNPQDPQVTQVDCDFKTLGYALFVINAGGSHADLTDEYAAIPDDMRAVASCFDRTHLRDVEPGTFFQMLPELRQQVSDRAILRAMHFFAENQRVLDQTTALHDGRIQDYLTLMQASGDSSANMLQNIYPADNTRERSVSLALALCQHLLAGQGAWRVHGGGFAGTVQALVPLDQSDRFREKVDAVFGQGSCIELLVRPDGGVQLSAESEAST